MTGATRVLVVEDDPTIRQLVAYALSDEGYEVEEAANGRAALERVERRHPDLIILDMKMPEMDGWEFALLYRARYAQRVPIIVLTAARDAAQRSEDIGAESYVAKPFDLEDLIGHVQAIMSPVGLE